MTCKKVQHSRNLHIYLMSMKLGLILLSLLVISESANMHGLPCPSLGHCFGNPSDVNTDPTPSVETNSSRLSKRNYAPDPVITQPESLQEQPQHKQPQRTVSCISNHSTRTRRLNGTNSNSVCWDKHDNPSFESPPPCQSFSESSEDELELECSPELELKYPQIPRPSIIIKQHKVRTNTPEVSVYLVHNNETELAHSEVVYNHLALFSYCW